MSHPALPNRRSQRAAWLLGATVALGALIWWGAVDETVPPLPAAPAAIARAPVGAPPTGARARAGEATAARGRLAHAPAVPARPEGGDPPPTDLPAEPEPAPLDAPASVGLSDSARTEELYENDTLVAVRVEDVVPGGFYDRMGFEDGDEIRAINTVPLDEAATPAFLFKEMAFSEKVTIEVVRQDGRYAYLPIPTSELWGALMDEGELGPVELVMRFWP